MKIMEDNGRKVKNGPQKRHIDVDLHVSCVSYLLVFGPSGSKNRKYSFLRRILLFKTGLATPTERTTEQSEAVGGGRGRVNPPPRRLVLEVLEVWRVDGSGPLHA